MDLAWLAAGIGAGLVVIGGGLGIGKLASSAMDATGRQPEAAGAIRTSMIIAAHLSKECHSLDWLFVFFLLLKHKLKII
jgi:F-type H+-transporting ATPase subunit c